MSVLNKFSLAGKTALVTGCDRGIGQAMAIALAEAGADVVGSSLSDDIKSGETEKAITALGRKFTGHTVDLSDREGLYKFINEVKEAHPVIDILINNAGMILRKPVAEHPDEWWDKVIDVNLNAQ